MLRRALVHFRLVLGGIGAGVSILVVAEMTLRLLDVGNPRVFESARSADGTRTVRLAWNAPFDKAVPPAPQREFPADKPPAAYRIFVIGESAAEGVPYGTGFAFSAWLARRLEAQAPDVQWEVVNAALGGAQSWSALMIVRDIARWSPDLLVVYLGTTRWERGSPPPSAGSIHAGSPSQRSSRKHGSTRRCRTRCPCGRETGRSTCAACTARASGSCRRPGAPDEGAHLAG
jgi:hypothetical protein